MIALEPIKYRYVPLYKRHNKLQIHLHTVYVLLK